MRFRTALLIVLSLTFSALAEQLKPATVAAFDQYVSQTERRMRIEVK